MNSASVNFVKRTCLVLTWLLSLSVQSLAWSTDSYTVDLYQTYCQGCHVVPGANIPVSFNQEHWNQRMKKGINALVDSAVDGMGNMPAQGLCQECTYEDFENLINYMAQPEPATPSQKP